MSTGTASKEGLQQMIYDVREMVYKAEDHLHKCKKPKKEHERKIAETVKGWLQNFEKKTNSNSADLTDLSMAIASLNDEYVELEAKEAQCVKDMQTTLQSSVMTDVQVADNDTSKKRKRLESNDEEVGGCPIKKPNKVYEGEIEDGKMNGQGTLRLADGSVYEGEWKDGNMHGKGTYTSSYGSVYEGEWKDDKKHGKGKLTFSNGDVYEGEWKDGKMNGKGKMTYSNGSVYEGKWKDDKKHGKGTYTSPSGSVYCLTW